MKDMIITTAVALLVIGLLAGGGFVGGCAFTSSRLPKAAAEVSRDTVVIRDTVREVRPAEVVRRVVARDTVRAVDTLRLRDTLFVEVERERVEYSDSLFRAVVSGVRPRLDTIEIYSATRVVTVMQTQGGGKTKRWGVGIQSGVGYTGNGVRPYIGVGISYDIWQF